MNLTAPARAILAFTIAATLAMDGWVALTIGLGSFLQRIGPDGLTEWIPALVSVLPLAAAAWAYLLASGVAPAADGPSWPEPLAQAARVLAVVLVVIFALHSIGALANHRSGFGPYGY